MRSLDEICVPVLLFVDIHVETIPANGFYR